MLSSGNNRRLKTSAIAPRYRPLLCHCVNSSPSEKHLPSTALLCIMNPLVYSPGISLDVRFC